MKIEVQSSTTLNTERVMISNNIDDKLWKVEIKNKDCQVSWRENKGEVISSKDIGKNKM